MCDTIQATAVSDQFIRHFGMCQPNMGIRILCLEMDVKPGVATPKHKVSRDIEPLESP